MPKIVAISDTHGNHLDLGALPAGDILIHAGDCTDDIGQASLRNFLKWMEIQPFAHKIFIAGNHDGAFEKWPDLARSMVKEVAPSCTYLQDSGCEFMGLKLWGSPVTPEFFDWHFNRKRGSDIKRHWDMIPEGTDVLITHGPPKGYGDWTDFRKEHAGDDDLLDAIKRIKPKLAFNGHFHHKQVINNILHEDGKITICINATSVNERYKVVNRPVVINV